MNVLEVNQARKQYSNHLAVNNVTFSVPKGCIFGLLGPNGAGKTSLIRIITGITQADSGEVVLDGGKLNGRHPSRIGYMPEERGLYKKMKVGDHLLYIAQLKGLSKAEAKKEIAYWFKRFDIADWQKKKVEELSKGMQQKVQFIATVIHKPSLLILDEPFSGLDPINANLMKEEIFELCKNGTSVILSTHRMEQVEEICEYIVLINQGQVVLNGKLDEVKDSFKEHKFRIRYQGSLPVSLPRQANIVEHGDGEIIIQVKEDKDSNLFLDELIRAGVMIRSFEEILPTVNEIFIKQVESTKTPTA